MSDLQKDTIRSYLTLRESSLKYGWKGYFRRLESPDALDMLALIDPEHLRELCGGNNNEFEKLQRKVQGARAFSIPGAVSSHCASRELWGYDCPLDSTIHFDHHFPYSRGGPTVPQNRIFLCEFHNSLKGGDVHCFFSEGIPTSSISWIKQQFFKMQSIFL